jgi:hypothetical protein
MTDALLQGNPKHEIYEESELKREHFHFLKMLEYHYHHPFLVLT